MTHHCPPWNEVWIVLLSHDTGIAAEQDGFAVAGIAVLVPEEDEQAWIHEKYMSELVNGISLPETRQRLLAIVEQLIEGHGIQGLILGGTELPLILR